MPSSPPSNFLASLIADDVSSGRYASIRTRFPPEPNGYLHIGHAKSICLNFGLSQQFPGRTHLRFDDTNPTKEEQEYVDSIQADVRWLGFDWGDHLYFASDFFGQMYDIGEKLIREGHAYVCAQSEEEMRAGRGTVEVVGTPSPWRDRPVGESLDLFRRMRAGEFPDGALTLRGRIDMAAANMKLRDPPLYRIRHALHHRTGDAWCLYPMYDYAHPLCDALEGITHSICTLEFENNRDIYDWLIAHAGLPAQPRQYEFARLSLTYTVLSKRKLITLVQDGQVRGWDDPRMPTLAGLRRRGVTAAAIRDFCDRIGVAKANSVVDIGQLEYSVREDLNATAPRYLAVLKPLRVDITDLAAEETVEARHFPEESGFEGTRPVTLTASIWIDRDDFAEVPPAGWHRLAPGASVRLRYGGLIRCDEVVKDAAGTVVSVRCSRPSTATKVSGTLQWVSVRDAVRVPVRLYDRLFTVERPDAGEADFRTHLNPESLVETEALAEPALAAVGPGVHVQFERIGYFYADPVDSRPGAPVFNRVVTLKDTWSKTIAAPVRAAPTPKRAEPPRVAAAPAELSGDEAFLVVMGASPSGARVFAADRAVSAVWSSAVAAGADPAQAEHWLVAGTPREVRTAGLKPNGEQVADLLARIGSGALTGRQAKDVWAGMLASGEPAGTVAARLGAVGGAADGVVAAAVAEVLAAHPDKVAAYRAGKVALAGFFVGEVMKRTRGAADPQQVQEGVKAALG